jgi:SRSO17 transposase
LELYDRARANGVHFEWLTFDELYGHSRDFLAGLRSRRQKYVAEVPVSFYGWTQEPGVTNRTYRKHLHCGSVRKTLRRKADSPAPKAVGEHLQSSPELSRQRWRKFHVKDGEKGPQIWEAKHVWFYPHDGEGMPLEPVHLLVTRNVLAPQQIKYFIAFAPRETPLEVLLLVAFSRWRVERCFEDQKTELGFDHFEGRTYVGLLRHQLVTAVTHLFLSRMTLLGREKKSAVNRLPGAHGLRRDGPIEVTPSKHRATPAGTRRGNHSPHPTPPGRFATQSPQTHNPTLKVQENPTQPTPSLPLGAG